MQQVDQEKRQIKNHRQIEKYHGRVSNVAFTASEKEGLQGRAASIEAERQTLGGLYDEAALCVRREFEQSKTQWTLIEVGLWAPDGQICYYFTRPSLDSHVLNCLHGGGRIEEVFINRQRLTPNGRRDVLAPAIQHERARSRGFC